MFFLGYGEVGGGERVAIFNAPLLMESSVITERQKGGGSMIRSYSVEEDQLQVAHRADTMLPGSKPSGGLFQVVYATFPSDSTHRHWYIDWAQCLKIRCVIEYRTIPHKELCKGLNMM